MGCEGTRKYNVIYALYGKVVIMSAKVLENGKSKLKVVREIKTERPERAMLSAEESLKRMKDFEKRKDKFIASIRKSKG